MDKLYSLIIENTHVLVSDEHSKIGYSYPRIFIEVIPHEVYVNIDCALGCVFNMSESDFNSWLDGSEITDANLDEVCDSIGLRYNAVFEIINALKEEIKDEE